LEPVMRASMLLSGVVAVGIGAAMAPAASAAENATGLYLLGVKTSMAGFVPPPGTYVTDINFYYSGSASGAAAVGIALRQTGNLAINADVDVQANAYINAPLALWIAPEKVLGGNVGLGVMVPVGWKGLDVEIDALATLTLPNGTVIQRGRQFELQDSTTNFGDPVLNALIGWHDGNWHSSFGALLNVPIGPWETESITNLSFHRWALDTSGSLTYFDPKSGHEVSVTAGFTFNGENPATDYKTGTEFHVELALMQHVSKTFSFGIAGYHYEQITGDSGAGARLGGFEGHVTGIGPDITYTFMCGKTPISAELKYFREFNVANRATGDAGYLNLTVPLSSGH
jgi:hypothetical protein